MRAIVLAAGEGRRLRPLTNDRPKCLVPYRGQTILERQEALFRRFGINPIVVVVGYHAEAVNLPGILPVMNADYDVTNMVHTLFCAREHFKDDLVVSYGDIIYDETIFRALLDASDDIAVAVSMNWRELWEQRMADPLQDAETMKMDHQGYITELGKKPKGYHEIQGQYMGLYKMRQKILPEILDFYDSLDRQRLYDGKPFSQMYMTSFLQELINASFKVKAVPVCGKWLEIDQLADLNVTIDF